MTFFTVLILSYQVQEQLLELAEAYEALIIEVVADLTDGEPSDKINYRIYKRMQGLMLEYFGEVM